MRASSRTKSKEKSAQSPCRCVRQTTEPLPYHTQPLSPYTPTSANRSGKPDGTSCSADNSNNTLQSRYSVPHPETKPFRINKSSEQATASTALLNDISSILPWQPQLSSIQEERSTELTRSKLSLPHRSRECKQTVGPCVCSKEQSSRSRSDIMHIYEEIDENSMKSLYPYSNLRSVSMESMESPWQHVDYTETNHNSTIDAQQGSFVSDFGGQYLSSMGGLLSPLRATTRQSNTNDWTELTSGFLHPTTEPEVWIYSELPNLLSSAKYMYLVP